MQQRHRLMRMIRRWVARILLFFFVSTILAVVIYRFAPVPVTPLMLLRLYEQHKKGETVQLHHHWVALSHMSAHMPVAVIASEDQRFMQHHGFDFREIGNALSDQLDGKRRRGGSTISQQTAKNVFLWPQSSWLRKGFETYFTLLIELIWSKQRIMEVYLNTIEMGHGIYGVQAVADDHFHCQPSQLSRSQCALVAATLPNPLKYNSAHPSPYMLRRQKAILAQMKTIAPFPMATGGNGADSGR